MILPWFLVGDYPQLAKVIDESMKTNDSQPTFVLERIYEIMEENLSCTDIGNNNVTLTERSIVSLYLLTNLARISVICTHV